MATIREVKKKRSRTGSGWQAIVRRRGYRLSRVLENKQAARDWAGRVEAAINASGPDKPFNPTTWEPTATVAHIQRHGTFPKVPEPVAPDDMADPSLRWTVRRAFQHYENTVLPGMKGEDKALSRTKAWKGRAIADKRLDEVTRDDVKAVIAERKAAKRAPNTIRNDAFSLSALYTAAREEWQLDISNPVHPGDLPPPPPGRQARLQDARGKETQSHEERIRAALAQGPDAREMADLLTLALDTGMRRGEIVVSAAGDLRREDGVDSLHVPNAKTGPRTVVLTARAAEILERRCADKEKDDKLFTLTGDAVQYRLELARARAGLPHVRFHDLRHEALSRMAGRGLTIGELQNQSGHATAQILLRYINARAGDIKGKLG